MLIALEFTDIFPSVTGFNEASPNVSELHVLNVSPYLPQFVAYALSFLIVLLDPKSIKSLFNKPIFHWASAFLILFTWGMLRRTLSPPAGIEDYEFLRTFGLQVNCIAFLVACVLIFDGASVLFLTRRAIAVATILGVVLNFYELIYPGTFSAVAGRAAGLYANSNGSGMALTFGCLVSLSVISAPWREEFVLLTFLAVAATFSREAIIAILLVIANASLAGVLSKRRLVVGLVVAFGFLLVFSAQDLVDTKQVFSEENLARLSFHASDASAEDRRRIRDEILEQFEQAPLLGQGFGTSAYWADEESHNLYVSLLADYGIVGILLIPVLILSIVRRSWESYAFALVFLVWCFFNHYIFYDAFAVIVLAIQANEAPGHRFFRLAHSPKRTFACANV